MQNKPSGWPFLSSVERSVGSICLICCSQKFATTFSISFRSCITLAHWYNILSSSTVLSGDCASENGTGVDEREVGNPGPLPCIIKH